ncbi:hypothetical protein [Candidatus Carsonella ruddii]|uniref:hypothetical protein n=1 Tax=Carsonella ruddii TaxID=114186 RepID=UPI003D9A146E
MMFLKDLFQKIIGIFKFNNNKIIKFGIDPTFYSIHLGHFFIFNFIFFLLKKKFLIIIILGDFTTILKKNINKKEIILNSICLKSQIYNIIGDVYIFFNSIWIYKKNFFVFLKIFNLLNINKYINKNLKFNINFRLNINNVLYPLFQAYDSLIINSFIEIGGIDQLLNIICGRFIQKIFNIKKQNSILFYLLEKNNLKISKSNNSFFLNKKILDINLLNKIFFNIKFFFKNYEKKNFFLIKYYNKKFFTEKKKCLFFKEKNFLSFYFKKIFLNNKFFFNKYIYEKNFFINKKLVIKNFLLKKNIYIIKNNYIKIYDK